MPISNNVQQSLHILGFLSGPPSSLNELNKRYRMLALKHHPDKNIDNHVGGSNKDKTEYGVEDNSYQDDIFKDINDAHKKVKNYYFNEDNTSEYFNTDNEDKSDDYNSIFNIFINSLICKISKKTNTATDNITTIVQAILCKGIQSAVLLFRNMDKHSCIAIYDILSTNQELFSISQEIIQELNEVVESKFENDVIIKLNPTLSDMLLDKVYVLNESGHSYYIPLWHTQLHFKYKYQTNDNNDNNDIQNSDAELIVICEPEVPKNVTIDENNHIYINIDVNICELFKNQEMTVIIDEETKKHGFEYKLYARDVSFQSNKKQCVRLYGSNGLASVYTSVYTTTSNRNDSTILGGGFDNTMYDVTKRSNVYAIVKLIV